MGLMSFIESLIDPLVKKVTKGASKGKTGKEMSDAEYEEAKSKGLKYLDEGTTGDAGLDSFMAGKGLDRFKGNDDFINKLTSGIRDFTDALNGGTNETNKAIADENLAFQKEKFDYDKALQEEIFQREDTSYQRSVNDMRLAGLNPLNMQNTNGSGEAIATTAPHNDYVANPMNYLQTFSDIAMQAKTVMSNHSLQQAQANLINKQADNQRIKNLYEADILSGQLAGLGYDNQNKWFESSNHLRDLLFNQMMGWTKDMPDWMKQSSARMGWKPFNFNMTREGIENPLKDPLKSYYSILTGENKPEISIDGDISSKLLSDELLTGTLGIFGNILKLIVK